VSTGFGVGYCPFAPGTMGALLAGIIWLAVFLLCHLYVYLAVMYVIIFLLLIFGIKASTAVEYIWGKDPSRVVVDEMVGVLLPLMCIIPMNGWYWFAIAAFVLFRLFDIFKPLGIRRMERLEGGAGIMADDLLAGIYSSIIILGAEWVVING
jgi:phosphatidylglycerophosphatase A